MDLPEIQHLVAELLEPKDALACMQVSRSWHVHFSERAFRHARIRCSGHSIKHRLPTMGWMQKYGGFIQELSVKSSEPLHSLLATADPQEQPQNDTKEAAALLSNLKALDISINCCVSDTVREVDAWLQHCPRLEFLILCNVKRLSTPDIDAGHTTVVKDRVSQLLKHCPMLTGLEIDNMGYHGSLQAADLAKIIRGFPPLLKEFRLIDGGAPRPWFAALSGFLGRLTILDLSDCRRAEDWMLKRILCLSPHLVQLGWYSFDVNGLFIDEDAGAAATASITPTSAAEASMATMTISAAEENGARMGPWACIGLRKLTLCTICWSDSPFRNKAAMEHLGLLKDLRRLTIDVMIGDIDSAHGLWHDEPRVYWVHDLKTVPEVRWMRETWPHLEYFELRRWSWI